MANERGPSAGSHYSHRRDDLMLARPQEFEHPLRVLSVNRLPKDQPIDTNDCIGRDYHGIRVNKPGGLGLGAGQAARDNLRISGCWR